MSTEQAVQAVSPTGPASRTTALREAMRQAGLDAVWISRPENVRYLSGFTSPADGKLLFTAGPAHESATLYTDARYTVQAQDESRYPAFIARPPATLEHAAPLMAGLRVGFEADHLTVSGLEELNAHWQAGELVGVRGLVEALRLIKSPDEIADIRAAQDIADAAFAAVRPSIVAGAREDHIAAQLEQFMRERGGASAFDITVASGPRGAMPHGAASERVIGEHELVTVDFGARVNGYHSDMTRTVAVGDPDSELRRLYRAVLEAEETAVRAIRPGVSCGDLDKAARDILTAHGLGDYFAHSLGHGVGLAVHEGPGLRAGSEDVLEVGMVVTAEPGVYLPGVGGVRTEDLVLVTKDGYEVLSHSPKEQL